MDRTLGTAINFRSRGQRPSLDNHRVITYTVRHMFTVLYQNPISCFQLLRGDTRTAPKQYSASRHPLKSAVQRHGMETCVPIYRLLSSLSSVQVCKIVN